MRKLLTSFKKTRIRTRLIMSQALIALIPFLLVGMVGIVFSVREASKNIDQRTSQRVNQISQTLDIYVEDLGKLTSTMASVTAESGYPDEEGKKHITDYMTDTMINYDEIAGILVAYTDDNYISTGMTRISRDSFSREKWYQTAIADPNHVHMISSVTGRNIMTDVSYSVDDVFSIVKAVIDEDSGKTIGVLLLDVRRSIIASAIQDAVSGTEGFVYVLDENDSMVYTPINEVVYRINTSWFKETDRALRVNIKDGSYHVRYKTSPITGWKTVSVTSYGYLMADVYNMITIYAIMLITTMVLVVYLSLRLSSNITRPISNLRDLMQKAEEGDLTIRYEGDEGDEISQLGKNFNHMLERIQALLARVREEEDQKHQAQLKIVQEQFKPHFLYNTLDTINWMAREHKAMDIVKLVDALTNVFRISLSRGNDYIDISQEIKYISSYLYVQKTRYEDKLDFNVEADEDCMEAVVPKLILQPIIENAIYHGIKQKRDVGHINISVKHVDDTIVMTVEDDGKGMDKNTLNAVRKSLQTKGGHVAANSSFGLYYVRERLQLRYRDNFSILVDSTEGEGTRFAIIIPFVQEA
ncbi:MAG: sensor histidine kinase [Pseudobutyrivibrio sp.]|nr:sensor histidine kinase [Pseudobutyrivibrio sp.]